MKSFVVVTPTYNRARQLVRLYDSLVAQTLSYDLFDWFVVDDGSTDNTADLINDLMKDVTGEDVAIDKHQIVDTINNILREYNLSTDLSFVRLPAAITIQFSGSLCSPIVLSRVI